MAKRRQRGGGSRRHAAPDPPRVKLRAGRRRVVVAGLGIALLLAVYWYNRAGDNTAGVQPPSPDLSKLAAPVADRIRDATRGVREHPSSAKAWGRLGTVFEVHGLKEEAVACYRRAQAIDPDDYRWPYFLGICLRTSDQAATLTSFTRAVELKPDNAPVRACLGQTLLRLEKLNEAATHYRRALSIDADYGAAHVGLGRIALARGEPAAALVHLTRAARVAGKYGEVHRLLTQVHRRLGNGAAADARMLASVNDDSVPADDPVRTEQWWREGVSVAHRARRARFKLREGRKAEALAELERAVADQPDSADAHYELASLCVDLGHQDRAAKQYQATISLDPDYAAAHAGLAACLVRRGAYEPAAEQLEKALRADPSFHRARFNLGEILVRLGRTNEGIDAMRIAVEGMPANITARFSLAAALDQVGRPFDALSEYDAVLRIRPDHVDARVRRAIALSKTGGTDAAAAALVEVIQRHPDRIDAHANLALLLARAERHAQAADAFRAGLAQAPNDAFMTERLAWLLATCPDDCCRDGEEALALAQRLCTGRGAENPRFLDTLAAAEAETGDYESAITTATRAAELLEMLAGRRHATPGGGMPNPTEMAERVRKRIADYRSDKPYRDTQASERDP